jgi:hypothetical protein
MATAIEQLQAMRSLPENWDGYGAAAPEPRVIDLAQAFTGLFETLRKKANFAPSVLHVSPTRVGGVLIEWEDPVAQHEVEMAPDGSVGFLHLHKATGHIETRKFSPPDTPVVIHPGFLHELQRLLAA